jgi:CRP-like cAMP-binding protein
MVAKELDMLKNSPLFKDIDNTAVRKFLDAAEVKHYAKDEILSVEMQEDEDISFILEGEIRAEATIDKEGAGMDLGPGEFVGLVKFLQDDSPVEILTASAKIDTRLLTWKASQWRRFCDEDPKTGYVLALQVGRILVERMKDWHMNVLNTMSWGIE